MSKRVCPKCGSAYRKWETRCPRCGFKVKVTDEDKRRTERVFRQMKISRYASLISGPIFIGAGVFMMFLSNNAAGSPFSRYFQDWWIVLLLGVSIFIVGLGQQIQLSKMKDQVPPAAEEEKKHRRPR